MKVSVEMITYNHAKFVAQALDSVLMQQVNFDYEIVIGEDCSTDGTRDIVLEYQKRYPDKIRLLLRERNLGERINGVGTHQACQGQYVALLEGDDFWTCAHKLQRQVDYLDSHPECAMCCHNVAVVNADGSQELARYCSADQKELSTLEDLLAASFIPTCSTLVRNGLFSDFPDWYFEVPVGDWAFHILNAQHGKIGYINEVMAAYRVHSGGAYSGLRRTAQIKSMIEFCEMMNANLDFKYDGILRAAASVRYYDLAREHARGGDLAQARTYAIKGVVKSPLNKQVPAWKVAALFLRLFVPRLYELIGPLARPK